MKQQQNFQVEATNRNLFQISTFLIGSFILSIVFALFAVIFWCSRRDRRLKWQNESIHLKPLEINRRIDITPKLKTTTEFIQPDENSPIGSMPTFKTKKRPTKNLLERRGSNNALKLSITNKHRLSSNTPPTASPTEDYLKIATRRLTIEQLHERAKEMSSLSEEFWTIPTNQLEKVRICGIGIKNRYGTIIANEHSRVHLPELADDPVSSYINANYVRAYPDQSRAYIATQGPMTNTIIDFYRMIWQENVPIVVMMTRLHERQKSKCERYIPEVESHIYGPFTVRINSLSSESDYELRKLTIQFEDEERELHHYWYTAWPDHSCPERIQPLIKLIDHIEKNRIVLNKIHQRTGPVVVHCSAGIGRTGCFIAISNGIKQISQEKEVDIVQILCHLRQDRGGMIQTDDQYRFVYRTLSEYAREFS